MNDPTRHALEALRNEFKRASSMYQPLYHEQLISDLDVTAESWWAFANANSLPSDSSWQRWHGPSEDPDYRECGCFICAYDWFGRFFGNEAGLS